MTKFNYKKTTRHMAKNSLYKDVKYLKKAVKQNKPDVKYISWNSGYSTISSVGSMQNLTGIAQGLTATTRVGDVVQPKRISLTLVAELSTQTSTVAQPVRFILFRDNQQQPDTAPTMNDLLQTPSEGILSFINVPQQQRFTVLYDKLVPLQSQNLGQWFHKISIDLSKHKMIFNGPNNTDIQKNGIYLLIVGDQLITLPYFKYLGKMTYTDV